MFMGCCYVLPEEKRSLYEGNAGAIQFVYTRTTRVPFYL